jgi:hypothetical protein
MHALRIMVETLKKDGMQLVLANPSRAMQARPCCLFPARKRDTVGLSMVTPCNLPVPCRKHTG